MFYLLNQKQISINEYIWLIKQMSFAENINKLWTTTSSNFILLNWRTAKSLMTFYLKKIYCEFLRTCIWNYYKKCMICYECIKIDKTEALINFQCMLVSTLHND